MTAYFNNGMGAAIPAMLPKQVNEWNEAGKKHDFDPLASLTEYMTKQYGGSHE